MLCKLTIAALAVLCVAGTASVASADVQISMKDGHVTVLAKDATIRQILMEWARVGQTKVVNVERIPGAPITIELRDMPEEQALKVLLRAISGFMTAPRVTATAPEASVFDRIIVMPTLAAASSAPTAGPPPISAPSFPQPAPPPPSDDDQQAPNAPPAGNRGPVFVFPQPQVGATPGQNPAQFQPPPGPAPVQQQPPPAAAFPGAPTAPSPTGVSVPGMIVPVPAAQPGQQPQQQQQ